MSSTINAAPYLTIHDAAIGRNGQVIISDLNWEIKKGQHWAVVGPNGSGKTSLLEALAGKLPLLKGRIEYVFTAAKKDHDAGQPGKYAWDSIQLVPGSYSFSRLSHSPEHYYQQRFHSFETDDFPLVEEFLLTGYSLEGPDEQEKRGRKQRLDEIAGLLGIASLLNRRVVQLSNGETKRVLLTQALLTQPELLLLDHPFVGLDTQTRNALRGVINQISRLSVQLIMVSAPGDIPESITHVLEIGNGTVRGQYEREVFHKKRQLNDEARKSRKPEITNLFILPGLIAFM